MKLTELRRSFEITLELAMEIIGFVLSLLAASLAAAFGRFLIAMLLAAVAFGMGARLVRRRQQAVARRPEVPGWVVAGSLLLSLVEVAVLVEASETPLQVQQGGFVYAHWALALLAFATVYVIQVRLLTALSRRLESSRR